MTIRYDLNLETQVKFGLLYEWQMPLGISREDESTAFLQMQDPIEKIRRFPLLLEALRSHENPLTTRYFSQTPYACGRHEVRY